MKENDISYEIRGLSYKVYNKLGPGLLESIYEQALAYELTKEGFDVKTQSCLPVKYDDIFMDKGFRLDLLVEEKVIVEIKLVEELSFLHKKQLLTYLKISGLILGILINFNTININNSIIRIANRL